MFKRKPKSLGLFLKFYFTTRQRHAWVYYWQSYAYRAWLAARIEGKLPADPPASPEELVTSHYEWLRKVTLDEIRQKRKNGTFKRTQLHSLISLRWFRETSREFIVNQREVTEKAKEE